MVSQLAFETYVRVHLTKQAYGIYPSNICISISSRNSKSFSSVTLNVSLNSLALRRSCFEQCRWKEDADDATAMKLYFDFFLARGVHWEPGLQFTGQNVHQILEENFPGDPELQGACISELALCTHPLS